MIVYEAINKTNNKVYIGKTIHTLEKRRKKHENSAKKDKNNTRFYNSLMYYGFSNFDWEVIDTALTLEELNQKEIYHIAITSAYICKELGYNQTSGGDGGDTFTNNPNKELIRDKLRIAMTGKNNHRFGTKASPETLKKKSEALKGRFVGEKSFSWGRKHTPEELEKMSIANSGENSCWFGVTGKRHPRFGTKATLENKQNKSKIMKGRFAGEKHWAWGKEMPEKQKKEIRKNNKNNIKIIINGKIYQSIRDASRILDIHRCTIMSRLKSSSFPNYTYVNKEVQK